MSPLTKAPLFIPAERLKEKVSGHHLYKPTAAVQHAGQRTFDRGEAGRYVWMYKGSQVRAHSRPRLSNLTSLVG